MRIPRTKLEKKLVFFLQKQEIFKTCNSGGKKKSRKVGQPSGRLQYFSFTGGKRSKKTIKAMKGVESIIVETTKEGHHQ